MDDDRPSCSLMFIVTVLLGLLIAQRAAVHVRTVDFLAIFAGGVLLGVGVVGLARGMKERRARAWWSSPEYAPPNALRRRSACTEMLLLDGVGPTGV